MPQADILSFHPTMLVLPVFFLGGYFFFATYWAPRIMLTFKARAWLTRFQVLPVGFLSSAEGWPEIFLMFIQFGGLLYFISTLSLVVASSADQKLQPLTYQPPRVASFEGVGGPSGGEFFSPLGDPPGRVSLSSRGGGVNPPGRSSSWGVWFLRSWQTISSSGGSPSGATSPGGSKVEFPRGVPTWLIF